MDKVLKILIIRSAPMDILERAIDYLKDRFEGAKISVLAQPGVKDELEKDSSIDEVILYDKGFFNVFKIGRMLLNKLREERFDLLVILYNNIEGKGYFHPKLISFLVAPKDIFIYDVEENYYKLRILRYLSRRFLVFLLNSLFYSVAGPLLLLGYVFIFFPLWLIHRMKVLLRRRVCRGKGYGRIT